MMQMLGDSEEPLLLSGEKRRSSKAFASAVSLTVVVAVALVVVMSMNVHSNQSSSVGRHVAATAASHPVSTMAVADVIGPDLPLSNAQKLIYDNEKILYSTHGQIKNIWLGVYGGFNQSAQTAKDIPYNTYLALIYAQVQFHVAATAENIHMFIADAAYGLMISYRVKTGWLISESREKRQVTAEEREQALALHRQLKRLKESLGSSPRGASPRGSSPGGSSPGGSSPGGSSPPGSSPRGSSPGGPPGGSVKTDVANPAIASVKLAAANAAYGRYQNLKAQGNAQRQTWLNDLAARNAAKSMTLLQHGTSIILFTAYKITKTAELVEEYAWLINYTEYLRWSFGNTFVAAVDGVDSEWKQNQKKLLAGMDELEKLIESQY